MTTPGALTRLYDQLNPEERFRLMVAADARGDTVEAERLIRACPRVLYRELDAAFSRRWETARDLIMCVVADTAAMLGWLDLLTALADVVDATLHGTDGAEMGPVVSVCETATRVAAGRVRAVWEAFQDTCREDLGIEAELLLQADYPKLLDRLAQHAATLDGLPRDEAHYTDWRATAAAVWARGTGLAD